MNDKIENPYAAPQAELSAIGLPQARTGPRQEARHGIAKWTLIFLVNLPVACVLGTICCQKPLNALGMLPAIIAYYLLTQTLYRYSGHFARFWFIGAACVAMCQIYPIPHMYLGGYATKLFGPPLNFIEAFICSLIVGGGLIAVSLVIAGLFYSVWLFTTRDQRGNPYE